MQHNIALGHAGQQAIGVNIGASNIINIGSIGIAAAAKAHSVGIIGVSPGSCTSDMVASCLPCFHV